MNAAEAQMLLGIAASFDNRKPSEEAAIAWSHALGDLPFTDCRDAVVAHYRIGSEWLMPAKVIAEVKRIRAKRINDHPPLTPPPGPEGETDAELVERQQAWLADARRRIADGEVIDCDVAYGELKARHLPDVRALMPRVDLPTAPPPEPKTLDDLLPEQRDPRVAVLRDHVATTHPTAALPKTQESA